MDINNLNLNELKLLSGQIDAKIEELSAEEKYHSVYLSSDIVHVCRMFDASKTPLEVRAKICDAIYMIRLTFKTVGNSVFLDGMELKNVKKKVFIEQVEL